MRVAAPPQSANTVGPLTYRTLHCKLCSHNWLDSNGRRLTSQQNSLWTFLPVSLQWQLVGLIHANFEVQRGMWRGAAVQPRSAGQMLSGSRAATDAAAPERIAP